MSEMQLKDASKNSKEDSDKKKTFSDHLNSFGQPVKNFFNKIPGPARSLFALAFILSILWLISKDMSSNENENVLKTLKTHQQVQPSKIIDEVNKGTVSKIVIHDDLFDKNGSSLMLVEAKLKSGKSMVADRTKDKTVSDEITKAIVAASIKSSTSITEQKPKDFPIPSSSLILLLVLFGAFFILLSSTKKVSWATENRDKKITLNDVVGNQEVKRLLREVSVKIERQQKGTLIGSPPPKGILLVGDPGVGKTLLAKAFANEIKAEFFTCTGAQFAEMFVGVGASRARDLFKTARKASPSVIFIDEIDALGSRTGLKDDSERRAVINTFLAEMDGVNDNTGVLLIGATNHVESIDPALRRPGRFDRIINIPMPDTAARTEMLEKFVKNIPADPSINMRELALRTPGYSPAQLQAMVNEAAAIAERRVDNTETSPFVSREDLCQAQENLMLGIQEIESTGEDLMRVAVHELGHALVGHMLCPDIHVEKITVRGRGQALGYASSRQSDDRRLLPRSSMQSRLAMYLAGRQAELEILGDITSGHADDLRKANELALAMVAELGMGRLTGLVMPIQGSQQDSVAADIRELLALAEADAGRIIRSNAGWVKEMASRLMREETLNHDELFEKLTVSHNQSLPSWASEQVRLRLASTEVKAEQALTN